MVALSIFAPGSPALTAVPLGGAFPGGLGAVMQNEPKALIYSPGALLVFDAVLASDKRLVRGTGRGGAVSPRGSPGHRPEDHRARARAEPAGRARPARAIGPG